MQNLTWTQEGNRYLLMNGEELMAELLQPKTEHASFIIHNQHYQIHCKGFWVPRYEVELDQQKILQYTFGLWKSSGKISFTDGTEYQSEYSSKNGLKLRFLDNGKEILEYGIDHSHKKIQISFRVGIAMEDGEKLLILAAVGMSVFSSQVREVSGEDLLLLIA